MNKSTYIFDTILLQSERLSSDVELKNNVTDLDIFESMDKPYLTGALTVIDNAFLYENGGIIGGEKITVTIRSLQDERIVRPITKTFYIDRVLAKDKVNDNVQVLVMHLVEDVYYKSALINVNRFYKGKTSEIIGKLCSNFLEKEVEVDSNERENYKLIVPNMTPLEAMEWIGQRSQTTEGFPFYLFSTLVKDKLFFKDLEALLNQPTINKEPFTYHSSAGQSSTEVQRRRNIKSYRFEKTDNLLEKIQAGVVGADYQYIDTGSDKLNDFHFDVKKNVFDLLKNKNMINDINYSSKYEYQGKSFNEHKSKMISQIGGSYAYRETETDDYDISIGECRSLADYKSNINVLALDNFLKSNPITFTVDGHDFIDGTKHSTIGTNLRLEFTGTQPENRKHPLDKRISGNYLVYHARHAFAKEGYYVTMTGVKLNGMEK